MRWRTTPIDDLPGLLPQWQRLNEQAGDCALLHPDFVAPLVEAFATPACRLAILGDEAAPEAMAVVTPGRLGWSSLQIPNGPLGLWLSRPGLDLAEAGAALLRALPGLPVMLSVTQQDPDLLPRPEAGPRLATIDYITTARITVRGPFEDYWQGRSKNLKKNIRRQLNKLEREGVDLRLEILDQPGDMERAVADYARMETGGWKGQAGTAVRRGDRQSGFYVAMMRRFSVRGEAVAARLLYDGVAVASFLLLWRNGIVITLKIAYDEALARQTSPSLLLRHALLRHLFEGGRCRAVEFYGAVRQWHLPWTDEFRTMYHANLYRWPLVAALHRRRLDKAPPPALPMADEEEAA